MTSGSDRLFLKALEKKAPVFYPSAQKLYLREQSLCDWLFEPLEDWAGKVFGPEVFDEAVLGYAKYCMEVSKLQRGYEKTGVFTQSTIGSITDAVYENKDYMTPYMWAAILIYPFWPSMVEHLRLYRDEFIKRLPADGKLLELGCGHGVLTLLALNDRKDLRAVGYDISPSAIQIAERLQEVGDPSRLAQFAVKDVLDLDPQDTELGSYDGVVCAMIAEHLEDPRPLLESVSKFLKPGGIAFFSTALESAQKDHVFEFHEESEPLRMAEEFGLRARRMVSDEGLGVRGGRFTPRATAFILKRNPSY